MSACRPYSSWIVVSDRIKRLLEQTSLKHILIRETEVTGKGRERFEGQFWELTSDLILPPLSPYCKLMNNDSWPFHGDYDKGCHYKEGLYFTFR